MEDYDYWAAVRDMRLRVAEFLQMLSPAEWDAPSLCTDWRVRDVAGHLSMVSTVTTGEMLALAPRARFNPDRINTMLATRYGSRAEHEIIARIREHAEDRTTAKVLDTRNSLFDVIVHSQDMARPLGRDFPVPVDYARAGLDRVWAMGWPFRARRRYGGTTLCATDTEWTAGSGPELAGPAVALLMVITGRAAAITQSLHGPGKSVLVG